MGILDKLDPLYAQVFVPKNLIIENRRLGLLFRVLQIICLGWAFFNIWITRSYLVTFMPVSHFLEVWPSLGDYSDASSAHCTQAPTFTYQYSSDFSYSPTGCVNLPKGELMEKSGSSLKITTMIDDEITETASGADCNTLQASCTGTFSSDSSSCTCTQTTMQFTRNPEESVLHFNHGYQVTNHPGAITDVSSDSYTRGRDKTQMVRVDGDGTRKTISGQEGELLTVITSPGGTECSVGGRSRWRQSDVGLGITGSLREWMACAGVNLDDEFPELGSGIQGEVGIPKLRVTGAVLDLEMSYYNVDARTGVPALSAFSNFDGVVCMIKVSMLPQWSTWYRTGYTSVRDAQTGIGSYRYRQNHGVDINFHSYGAFRFMDYQSVITAIVNALVILSLPGVIIQFVASYGIGLISRIYYKSMNQPLNILRLASGIVSRLIVGVSSFTKLTQSDDLDKGITKEQLATRMKEAFKSDMDEGQLNEKEVAVLAKVVETNMDLAGSGEISLKEFLLSLTSLEPLSHEDLATLFDADRKRWLPEMIFTDSRLNVIRQLNKTITVESHKNEDEGPCIEV